MQGITHVHVHSCGRAALIAALAQAMGGPRYSLTLHGGIQDYGGGQRCKWRAAAFGLVVTRALLPDLTAVLGRDRPARIAAAPMGVETEVLKRSSPYEPSAPGEPVRLFTCARLNRFKGHQDLMRVMRSLIDEGLDLRLEIAGEDDDGGHGYRRELEVLIGELGLSDHVRLLGAIDAGAVRDKLAAAHIFVLASWREALSVAYMEAMSMGLPVIGTDVGGTRELIEDGVTGLLIAPQDHEALRKALLRLTGDPELARRLGAAARAHIEAGFHASAGAEILRDEIDRLTPATGQA
jgi:colanic acid/amylovoran biosynthesis glycosyltransferase